jgi:hypothetical protein
MKQFVVVCVALLVLSSAVVGSSPNETFSLADHVGEPNARSFFLFSTSAGNYIVRQDGMGEVASPQGMRRVFVLRLGAKGRIDRIYFLEHDGDLWLLYEVHDATSQWAYLLRMEQKKRKPRWLTPLPDVEIQAPFIREDSVMVGDTQISKADGHILRQD